MSMTMFINDKTIKWAIRNKLQEPAGKMVTQRMLEGFVQQEFMISIWKARGLVRETMREEGRQVL